MFTLSWSKKKKKKIYQSSSCQSKIPNSNQASVCIYVSQSKGLAQLGLGEVTESLFRGEGASGRLWETVGVEDGARPGSPHTDGVLPAQKNN